MRSMSVDLLTWYGISVTMMLNRPLLVSSISVRARNRSTLPRPGAKRLADAFRTEDNAAGGEVRTLNELHKLFQADGAASLPVVDDVI